METRYHKISYLLGATNPVGEVVANQEGETWRVQLTAADEVQAAIDESASIVKIAALNRRESRLKELLPKLADRTITFAEHLEITAIREGLE